MRAIGVAQPRILMLTAFGAAVTLSVVVLVGYSMKSDPVANAEQMNADSRISAAGLQSERASAMSSAAEAQKAMTRAFLGDSYSAGSGASSEGQRWSSVLSAEQGWIEDNYGVGGTGYANRNPEAGRPAYYERAADVASSGDMTIVVSGGRNDVAHWRSDPADTSERITSTFTELRAGAPTAQIIAINPWWDSTIAPPELEELGEAVREAVVAVGGTYLDTGQPLFGHPEFIDDDGIHPNDAGHAAIAGAVAASLA